MTAPQKKLPAQPLQFHWLSIARILWKGKVTLLALWVVLSLIAIAVVRRFPAVYRADCLLLVVGPKIPDKYVDSTVTSDPQERLAAISHVILSNTRLQEIIDSLGLYKDERKTKPQDEIIKEMRDNDISLRLESGLSNTRPDAFRVSYQAKDPQVAANVANRLAALIIDENVRSRSDRAEDTSQFLEQQLSQAKTSLDTLESKVGQYKASHSGELPEQQISLSQSLARLQVELQGNQEALNRAEQTKIMLQNTLGIAESTLATMEQTAKENRERDELNRKNRVAAGDPAVTVIRPKTRRQTVQEELDNLRLRYANDHPEIKRLKAELASLPPDTEPSGPSKQPAGTTAAQELPPLPAAPSDTILNQRERVASLKAQLTMAAKEFETTNANRTRVLRDIDIYQSRINMLPFREQEMATLTRDYETAKANYKSLLDKKLSAEMTTKMEQTQQGEKFTLIDPARVPHEPARPKRSLLNALGIILSLAISALVVVGRRLPKDIMLGEWELTPGVVILGRVPHIKIPKANLATLAPGRSTN